MSILKCSSSLQKKRQWGIVYLSTGEIRSQKMMEMNKKAANAGQLVRLLDIPVDNLVEDSRGMEPGAFINLLQENCARYYGVAGPEYIKRLISSLSSGYKFKKGENEYIINYSREELRQYHQESLKELILPTMHSIHHRVMNRLASVVVAGKTCTFVVYPASVNNG